jgi:hypothetical protein
MLCKRFAPLIYDMCPKTCIHVSFCLAEVCMCITRDPLSSILPIFKPHGMCICNHEILPEYVDCCACACPHRPRTPAHVRMRCCVLCFVQYGVRSQGRAGRHSLRHHCGCQPPRKHQRPPSLPCSNIHARDDLHFGRMSQTSMLIPLCNEHANSFVQRACQFLCATSMPIPLCNEHADSLVQRACQFLCATSMPIPWCNEHANSFVRSAVSPFFTMVRWCS